jgi:hypothetical protein
MRDSSRSRDARVKENLTASRSALLDYFFDDQYRKVLVQSLSAVSGSPWFEVWWRRGAVRAMQIERLEGSRFIRSR